MKGKTDVSARGSDGYALVVILLAIVSAAIVPDRLMHALFGHWKWMYPSLHSALEATGAGAALFVAMVLFLWGNEEKRWDFFALSAGFTSMGVLDAFHAASTPGHGFVLLHSMSGLVGGAFFALVWFPSSLPVKFKRKKELLYFIGAASAVFSVWVMLFRETLPAMSQNGVFTPAAVFVNMAGGICYLAAALYFFLRFRRLGEREAYLFCAMALLFGMAGLAFRFSSLWEDTWWMWHVLRVAAYVIVLAIVLRMHVRTLFALDASETRYRTLFEESPDGVVLVDPQTALTLEFNDAAHKQLGYSREEFSRLRIMDYEAREEPEETKARIEKILREGKDDFETKHRARDGKLRHMFVTVKTIRLSGREVFHCIFRDITEFKRAEENLLQQLARIQLLSDIAEAIAQRQDIKSIARVVLRNLEDHLHMDVGSVSLYDALSDTITVAARGPKSFELSKKLGTQEGAVIPVEKSGARACVRGEVVYVPDTAQWGSSYAPSYAQEGIRCIVAMPLMVENKLIGILSAGRRKIDSFSVDEREFLQSVCRHISLAIHHVRLFSDLQNAYEELRETQKNVMQQERLRALGQMASGIAHDMNNAISPVLGFADMLLEDEKALSPRAKTYLYHIRTSAADAVHIVSRMREFYRSRVEEDVLAPVHLNSLAKEVIELTRARWRDMAQEKEASITVKTDLTDNLPAVMGTESEIREALTNLIFNAVDAMPKGGELLLRAKVCDGNSACASRATLPCECFEVRDTGIGMTEEVRQRCLEPFYTTKGAHGTGLGLAMVYGVMKRHDGEIEIESEAGKGTTMRLVFPLKKSDDTGEVSFEAESEIVPPLHVLCVDDEPLLCELIKEILVKDGHHVVTAESGREGLEAFDEAARRGKTFDVVVTDLGMPYMSGREVTHAVKEKSPGTPVILLTGWGKHASGDTKFSSHVDVILSKPPKRNELRRALARVTKK